MPGVAGSSPASTTIRGAGCKAPRVSCFCPGETLMSRPPLGSRICGAIGLVALLFGCSAALTPAMMEQAEGLKTAQRIADQVTKAYGVARVRVYATSDLRPTSAAGYFYRQDWIFIRPRLFTGNALSVVLSHDLGHVGSAIGRSISTQSRRPPSSRTMNGLRIGAAWRFWCDSSVSRSARRSNATPRTSSRRIVSARVVLFPFPSVTRLHASSCVIFGSALRRRPRRARHSQMQRK